MTQHVFVSSTSNDLRHHRAAVRDVIQSLNWLPVMMEDFGTSPEATVSACLGKLRPCHLVVLLVAHRRGWVPTVEQGGDGCQSITALELHEARRLGIPVRILRAPDSWPGNLWEETDAGRVWMRHFRDNLNQFAPLFGEETRLAPSGEPLPGDVFRACIQRELVRHLHEVKEAEILEQLGAAGMEKRLPELLRVLSEVVVAGDVLLQLHKAAAPLDWHGVPSGLRPSVLLRCCVRSLAAAPRQSSGAVPLLAFLHALLPLVKGDNEKAALQAWLAEEQPAPAPLPPPPPAPTSAVLLIQIESSKFVSDAYRLKAWLLGVARPACMSPGDVDLTRAALPEQVAQLCRAVERQGVPSECCRLEFLLPRALLGFDVDQWPIEDELMMEPLPLGQMHRIVLRSLDRQRIPAAQEALRKRWAQLREQARTPCRWSATLPATPPCPVVRLDRPGGKPLLALLLDAPMVVGALMARAPEPTPTQPQHDLLGPLLKAGVPFACWLRGESGELAELIDVPLESLPERVQNLRNAAEASEEPNHPGRRLVLMWDNPELLSPDLDPAHQLRSPQER